jgi:hypothetical protein
MPIPDHPVTSQILYQLSHLYKTGWCVFFCWVPANAGIPGNVTDAAAKEETMDEVYSCDYQFPTDTLDPLDCVHASMKMDTEPI